MNVALALLLLQNEDDSSNYSSFMRTSAARIGPVKA
jgi:hypothetical protein